MEKTIRKPDESADPVGKLEHWAEQRRRQARKEHAAEVDDRVSRLDGPQ